MSVKRKYAIIDPLIIQEGDCTIAEMVVFIEDQHGHIIYDRNFSGSAVRNPIDKPNDDAAALIALGRALSRAGERLQKAGDGLVKNDIDTAAEKIKQAEKKTRRGALTNLVEIGEEMGEYDVIPPEVVVASILNKDSGEVYD